MAVQTAAAQFQVSERAKKYLELSNSVRSLKLDLSLAEKTSDLKDLKEKFIDVLRRESEIR